MINKYLQLSILSLIFALAITFSGVALGQTVSTWEAPGSLPPNCNPATNEGCNPPINAGVSAQTKKGILTLLNGIILKGTSFVESDINFIGNLKFLRFSATTDEVTKNSNDGKIGRLTGSDNLANRKVLDIIGVRQDSADLAQNPSVKNRLVRIWDNLWVSGDVRAKNYYICNEAGACSIFNGEGGASSLWLVNGSNIYYSAGNVGVGTNNPTSKLDVAGLASFSDGFMAKASSTINGNLSLSSSNGGVVDLSSGITTKAPFAGRVSYRTNYNLDWNGVLPYAESFISPARQIMLLIGGGATAGDRLVKVWDNLDVVGNITAANIEAHNNITATRICTSAGACVNVSQIINPPSLPTIPSSVWATTSAGNIYNTNLNNVGIGTNNPASKLTVNGTASFADGLVVKGNSIIDGQVQITGTSDKTLKIGTGANHDGKIGYQLNTADNSKNLDIIGVSQDGSGASGNRRVRIWDNLITGNILATNICTVNGTCVSIQNIINGITSFWQVNPSDSGGILTSKRVKTSNLQAPSVNVSSTGTYAPTGYVYAENVGINNRISAKEICLGSSGGIDGGVNCWSTIPNTQDLGLNSIICQWNGVPNGASAMGNCMGSLESGKETRNYILKCPDVYPKIVSGGAWCDSTAGEFRVLRESRPVSTREWKVSCIGINNASVVGINLTNNSVSPNGASIICSK